MIEEHQRMLQRAAELCQRGDTWTAASILFELLTLSCEGHSWLNEALEFTVSEHIGGQNGSDLKRVLE
jgi:hypothetical protein